MEKEKKPKAVKKTNTAANQTGVESSESKKPATKKKAAVVEMSANGAAPKKAATQKKAVAATRNATEPKVTQMHVSHDDIARLAHRYWMERGGQHGSHAEDWLRAERELRGKAS